MKCFYHSADLDGHCSGAIIKQKYPDCEMIGIDYGDDFPWEVIKKDEIVYMVDFSLEPFCDMEKLNDMCLLTWIDHHKTAIAEAQKRSFEAYKQKIRLSLAGCELTWEFCHPDTMMPITVYLLGRYDVWDHGDPRVLPFQYGMGLFDTNPENIEFWEKHLNGFYPEIMVKGDDIIEYRSKEDKKYCENCAFEVEFEGLKFIVINRILTNSKIFDSFYDPNKHDGMMTFGYRNKQWKVSMYSDKEDIDLSLIAKKHGGGGHKGACGFQCDNIISLLKLGK